MSVILRIYSTNYLIYEIKLAESSHRSNAISSMIYWERRSDYIAVSLQVRANKNTARWFLSDKNKISNIVLLTLTIPYGTTLNVETNDSNDNDTSDNIYGDSVNRYQR